MIDLSALNEKQKEAVICSNNHIIVIAGAGSGKTKVLTTRVAYLLDKGVKPNEILALTFTNKASNEMKERIEKITGVSRWDINATTFHSFAVKILRKHIESLNLNFNKNFKILDEEDSRKIMTNILEENNIEAKECKGYLSYRQFYQTTGIESEYYKTLPIIEFNSECSKNNLLTFDDLLYYLNRVFENESILSIYQNQFKYVMTDEFQDTDFIQYELLKKLSAVHNNLFVVGDDSQSIYSFRGSDEKIISEFMKDYPDYKLIKLEQNYRSTPEILNLANQIIENNINKIPKNLYTKNNNGLMPVYFETENYNKENHKIAYMINVLKNKGYQYKDIAILYRTNSLSRTFEETFITNKIPYVICNGTSFYQREEIKDLISYIRVIADDFDNYAFNRIINKPRRKVGEKLLSQIEANAIINQGNRSSNLIEAENYPQTLNFYKNISKIRYLYMNSEISSITKIIDFILKDLKYFEYVQTLNSSSSNDRNKNIEEFKNIIVEYEKQNPDNEEMRLDYLNNFLQSIALYTDNTNDNNGEEKNAVKLMTVHASKGLEFPVVFLPAFEEDIFPNARALQEGNEEEERRLYYVGITRAKKMLFISSAKYRLLNGKSSFPNPSMFLKEGKGKIQYR